jgi:transposase
MDRYCATDSAAATWRWQAPHRYACGDERPDVHPEHRLSMALSTEGFSVYNYFVWWQCDRVLDRIHHALYVECREAAEREASPIAAIIDSQSVKSAEKGGRIDPHGFDAGLKTEIVKRSDRASGFVRLPKRWIVERTIAWLNRCSPRQGLGESELQRPRLLENCLHPPHAAKTLQSLIKF